MDLICYLHPGWAPLIRPAPATRPWMDATPDAFAYRCLPLNIADAHGWEVLNPCGFTAVWDGRPAVDAVTLAFDEGASPDRRAVSIFGQGVVTFHVEGLIRTPPGWNLWIGGSPNSPKDGIQALTGVVETDWSPFTFTMNWRFTRAHQPVRFEAGEAIAFFFPVQRLALENVVPRYLPLEQDGEAMEGFVAWSRARDAFHARIARDPPQSTADHWQKHYYRGIDVAGRSHVPDHRTKLRLLPFEARPSVPLPIAVPEAGASGDVADREWLLEALERQRALAPAATTLERRPDPGRQIFLERYFAPARPVILSDAISDWPGLLGCTPQFLRQALAVGGPASQVRARLGTLGGWAAFVIAGAEEIVSLEGGDGFRPLHRRLGNSFELQIAGRRHLRLVPASEIGRLYADAHGNSPITDIDDAGLDRDRFPRLTGMRVYDVVLEPGEMLFLPFAWWHQARSLTDSLSLAYRDVRWPSDTPGGR